MASSFLVLRKRCTLLLVFGLMTFGLVTCQKTTTPPLTTTTTTTTPPLTTTTTTTTTPNPTTTTTTPRPTTTTTTPPPPTPPPTTTTTNTAADSGTFLTTEEDQTGLSGQTTNIPDGDLQSSFTTVVTENEVTSFTTEPESTNDDVSSATPDTKDATAIEGTEKTDAPGTEDPETTELLITDGNDNVTKPESITKSVEKDSTQSPDATMIDDIVTTDISETENSNSTISVAADNPLNGTSTLASEAVTQPRVDPDESTSAVNGTFEASTKRVDIDATDSVGPNGTNQITNNGTVTDMEPIPLTTLARPTNDTEIIEPSQVTSATKEPTASTGLASLSNETDSSLNDTEGKAPSEATQATKEPNASTKLASLSNETESSLNDTESIAPSEATSATTIASPSNETESSKNDTESSEPTLLSTNTTPSITTSTASPTTTSTTKAPTTASTTTTQTTTTTTQTTATTTTQTTTPATTTAETKTPKTPSNPSPTKSTTTQKAITDEVSQDNGTSDDGLVGVVIFLALLCVALIILCTILVLYIEKRRKFYPNGEKPKESYKATEEGTGKKNGKHISFAEKVETIENYETEHSPDEITTYNELAEKDGGESNTDGNDTVENAEMTTSSFANPNTAVGFGVAVTTEELVESRQSLRPVDLELNSIDEGEEGSENAERQATENDMETPLLASTEDFGDDDDEAHDNQGFDKEEMPRPSSPPPSPPASSSPPPSPTSPTEDQTFPPPPTPDEDEEAGGVLPQDDSEGETEEPFKHPPEGDTFDEGSDQEIVHSTQVLQDDI